MPRTHEYTAEIRWTGNRGTGTSSYRDYDRAHDVNAPGKPAIAGSSDPAFRGDPARWNPEELLVASLAQCHMLWFLHLAAVSKVVVTGYVDRPHGTMAEQDDGAGQFTRVVLRPDVTVADASMRDRTEHLHDQAHAKCYVARSVNFPVLHEPTVRTQ
jgi:organic hydroperoxide reductase OsmC/OhrA